MNIDKYLENVTSRPSFNYFAFQAATLFLVFVSSYIATFQYSWIFHKDVEALDLQFRSFLLLLLPVVLVVTFLEFIFFSIRKNLSQKLFSKSLILIHILFTYLFYSLLMAFCPSKEQGVGLAYLLIFLEFFLLDKAIIIFTIIPVAFLYIIENVGKLKLEPMQYMKNIWAFWFVVISLCILIAVIIFALQLMQSIYSL